jgi:hypothetical protein
MEKKSKACSKKNGTSQLQYGCLLPVERSSVDNYKPTPPCRGGFMPHSENVHSKYACMVYVTTLEVTTRARGVV